MTSINLKNILNMELKEEYLFSSREVIETQSKYYYDSKSLGFDTLVEKDKNYAKKIFQIIKEILKYDPKKKNISIAELGGGSGSFFLQLQELLVQNKINFKYHIIDVETGKFKDLEKKYPQLKLTEASFEEFGKNKKNDIDILIANEALDMWAGSDFLVEEYEEENILPYSIFWLLLDGNSGEIISKKALQTITKENSAKYFWQQIFINENNQKASFEKPDSSAIKIDIPETFFHLLQKVKYFSVVQDYWSYGMSENPLRMGITKQNLSELQKRFSLVYSEQRVSELIQGWKNEIKQEEKNSTWLYNPIIPFSLVDVTYSPDQDKLYHTLLSSNVEISSIQISEPSTFVDSFNEEYTDQTGEILLIFGNKYLELFKKDF